MQFIPGLKLSEQYHTDVVRPLLLEHFPGLPYAAARLDYGSDVLGFDTPMSMDHGWGPKLTLFLTEQDWPVYHTALNDCFAYQLPFQFIGFPTHFGEPLSDGGVMTLKETYPIKHGITITTAEMFFREYLGVEIDQPVTPAVWLTIPQQRLRTLRSGKIYHDELRLLSSLREQFDWYPADLWLYLMANQWQRINQTEPFIGRALSVNDLLGARLIATGQVVELMRLCFLIEKQYMPYTKWFGTAFQQLQIAPDFSPIISAVLNCSEPHHIETHLSSAYLKVIAAHNSLLITPTIEPQMASFHNRPFLVPHSERIVTALLAEIKDPAVQALPPHLGSIDQITDNTDYLESIPRCQGLRFLY